MRGACSTRLVVSLGVVACFLLCFSGDLLAQEAKHLCAESKVVSKKFYRGFKERGWKELAEKDITRIELEHGESFWVVETTGSGETEIHESVYGEDTGKHQTYCYSKSGVLEAYQLQMNTAWGWAFERLSTRKAGRLVQVSSRFFNIDTGKTIARPELADDLGYWMKPEIYSSLQGNPIVRFFKKATNATTH